MSASTARKPSETRGSVSLIKLSDGNTIPQLGMGVWEVDPGITARVVRDGIAAGYRLIDTAEGYHNEEGVGEAIKTGGVPRDELFITSKLRNGGHDREYGAEELRCDDEGAAARRARHVPHPLAGARARANMSKRGRRWSNSSSRAG